MKRILIAGTHSGCGKTTVVCGILAALKNRGIPLRAFKCGPDYIDPMFHRSVLGIPSWNLDPYFLEPKDLLSHFTDHALTDGAALIEGVMGYYDGIAMTSRASTFSVAAALKAPVVLVVNAAGTGNSIAAVIEGFVRHEKPSGIRGVIFNNCSSGIYLRYKELAERIGVKALGYMPRKENWNIESRHLGLTVPAEIPSLREKFDALGEQTEKSIDLEGLLDLAASAIELPASPHSALPITPLPTAPRPAVARDEAFCFIFEENLEILRSLGCELVFFSPLEDTALPSGVSGLYLPGGYPEVYASKLSENSKLRHYIREAINQGLPTIAECGGFLYLHETLDGFPMAGVFPAAAFRTPKLQRFGYVEITAEKDNLLCPAGGSIRAHEFHYWESSSPGNDFIAHKASGAEASPLATYPCIHASPTLYAGFPHLYFPANPAFAYCFVEKMVKYQR
jgi:cobyrinic acid a,c-diamide synthase